jgi:nicotinamidase-related amidase
MKPESALVIIDMISCWDFPDAEHLLPHALRISRPIANLKRRCKREGLPVIYANDNRGRWQSNFSNVVDLSLKCGGDAGDITQMLMPEQDDYFVLKPKQSAFFGTPFELLLQHLGVSRLIVTGVASDQCVLVTVVEARMRDLNVVVPRDCIASQAEARNNAVLLQLEQSHKLPTTPGRFVHLTEAPKIKTNTSSTLRTD